MKNIRITVRLPVHIIRAVDMFVKLGEFSCRSDVIRHGLNKLIEQDAERVIKKAEKIERLTKLEALSEALKEYNTE